MISKIIQHRPHCVVTQGSYKSSGIKTGPISWRQINLGLNLSRCRVALRPAVLSAARIWPSVSRYLEISFGLRGPSPQAFTPFRWGGWVHCPAPEAPLTRGMPTGPRAFLANSGRVWATALRPVPPKKGLVPYMPVRWGVHQIPQLGWTPAEGVRGTRFSSGRSTTEA